MTRMDFQESAASAGALNSSPRTNSPVQNPDRLVEVECLLSGRTRDIRLKGELHRLFLERTWSRTAKIIRAWMVWVSVLDIVTLALNAVLLPKAIVWTMLPPASILPPVALAVYLVWRKPRALWFQHLSLVLGTFLILASVALVGVAAGGEFYERHLTIMLFVAVTAIIIFYIPLGWTTAIASFALVLYMAFQLRNPVMETGSAVAATLFFACGIVATVVARRTMMILDQKTFLLEVRDRNRVRELADANARLERLARTDPLTGVANRRSMMEALGRLWNTDIRQLGGAMLMCDIDEFKNLNDRLGHGEGDRCLVKVAGIIESSVRRDLDHVARYGGEEFLVALPGMGAEDACAVAERIRKNVEAASLPNPSSRVSSYVTLSIGVAVQPPNQEVISPVDLQNQADVALYRAKQTGRNRVVLYEDTHENG
jgi:diguanylate cyclase (GGDEF)-like protein